MKKDDWKNILMIIATLIVSVISLGFFNIYFQLIFIIFFVIICCLVFSYLNKKSIIKKNLLILLCIVEFVVLGISINNEGSFVSFFIRIKNLFAFQQEVVSDSKTVSNENFESYFDDLNIKLENLDQKIEDTNIIIEQMDNSFNSISNNIENIRFNENIDEIEIDRIVEMLEKYAEEYGESFPDLKTDIYSLELLYKIFISEEVYYYCNILKGFQKYGIDTDALHISENTFFIWDVETLYITYNMQKKNLDNLCLDENAMGESFSYNEYKITMQKYSDTFDYGDWRRNYNDVTAAETEEKLNNVIRCYYKKFVVNFSE